MSHVRLSHIPLLSVIMLALFSFSGVSFADSERLIQVKPGIYRKVIVRTDDAKLYSEPGGGTAEEVKPFSIFFKLKTDDGQEEKDGYFLVGDGEGNPLGWIKREQVFHWDTRFLLQPNAPPRDGVYFTVRSDKATAQYKGSAPKRHEAICPVLEEPTEGNNPQYTVAFFTAESQTHTGSSVVATEQRSIESLQLEIVFVIDTTASMTPLIEGTKEVANRVADFLAKNPETGRLTKLGLVQYRDLTPEITFSGRPAQVVTPLTDYETFRVKLAPLHVAPTGSEEVKEDVLAGVLLAIEQGGWSAFSSKHIVLLGDASAHLTGPKNSTGLNIEAVLSRAQRTGGAEAEKAVGSILFHAVRAKQPDAPFDEIECKQHFQKFAQNAGRFQGYYADLDPNNASDRERVVSELANQILEALTLAGQLRSGTVSSSSAPSTTSSPFAKAVWDIHVAIAGEPIEAVEKGTATIRSDDGDLLARQFVMVSEDDLRRLRSTLDLLQVELGSRVEPTKRGDVGKLLSRLKTLLLTSVTGQDLDEDTPLETVITNLPLKTDVLKTTVRELAQKDADGFKKWLEGLDAAKKRADDLLNRQADDWSTLSEKATNQRFAYILLQDMP